MRDDNIDAMGYGVTMNTAKTVLEVTAMEIVIGNYKRAIKKLDRICWILWVLVMSVTIVYSIHGWNSMVALLVGFTFGHVGKLRERMDNLSKKLQQLEYARIQEAM